MGKLEISSSYSSDEWFRVLDRWGDGLFVDAAGPTIPELAIRTSGEQKGPTVVLDHDQVLALSWWLHEWLDTQDGEVL